MTVDARIKRLIKGWDATAWLCFDEAEECADEASKRSFHRQARTFRQCANELFALIDMEASYDNYTP